MESKKPAGPTIIAVRHRLLSETKFDNETRMQKVRNELEKIHRDRKKRVLFVEAPPSLIHNVLGIERPKLSPKTEEAIESRSPWPFRDPFCEAIRIASKNGYKIIGLNRDIVMPILYSVVARQYENAGSHGKENLIKIGSYINQNLSEKYWADIIRRRKATPNDIILIHPNHVAGLLRESGFRPKELKWLDKPVKKSGNRVWRLNKRELDAFMKKRALQRKLRQNAIAMRRKPK
ncbi:MAG: hypothetical protein WC602_02495 [archaeon]